MYATDEFTWSVGWQVSVVVVFFHLEISLFVWIIVSLSHHSCIVEYPTHLIETSVILYCSFNITTYVTII